MLQCVKQTKNKTIKLGFLAKRELLSQFTVASKGGKAVSDLMNHFLASNLHNLKNSKILTLEISINIGQFKLSAFHMPMEVKTV